MHRPLARLDDTALRRTAAGAVLVHVAGFVVAVLLSGQPVVHDGQAGIEHSLVERDPLPVLAGMYALVLGFLALLVAMTFLAHAVGRRSARTAWASQTAWAAGLAYVVVIVGVGLSAGAAGLWALDRGTDLTTVLAVNNIRNFSYFVATPCMGLYAVALGVAAIGDGVLRRWVGWGGVTVGVALLLAVPLAAVGIQYAQPLWLLWWVGTAVSLWRHDPAGAAERAEAPTRPVRVGHD